MTEGIELRPARQLLKNNYTKPLWFISSHRVMLFQYLGGVWHSNMLYYIHNKCQVSLPTMNEVVGADDVILIIASKLFSECMTSSRNSAIFLPPMADGSTRAT
jgi:hypothetical protein